MIYEIPPATAGPHKSQIQKQETHQTDKFPATILYGARRGIRTPDPLHVTEML